MAVALVGTTCLPGGSRPRLFSGSPSRFYASSPTYLRVSCFSSPSEPVSSFESSSLPLENLAFNFQLIYVQSFILFFLLSFVCVGLLAQMEATNLKPRSEYKPGFFDDLFLDVFRSKMVQVCSLFSFMLIAAALNSEKGQADLDYFHSADFV